MGEEILLEVARLQREAITRRHMGERASQYTVAVLRALVDMGRAPLAESLGQDYVALINRWESLGFSPARSAARILQREAA